MGCGKTTIGSRLAEILNLRFVDTDARIEKEQGMTISKIFETKGESYFRELETETLRELLENNERCGISVGGGLPLREENRKLLQQLGKVIYLKAQPDTIYNRLKGDTTRPLLQTKNTKARIEEMLDAREEKYMAAAGTIVRVDEKDIFEIVDEVLKIIKED